MKDDNRIDFGQDSDDVPPIDPHFDAWITKAAPTLNAPNPAPRGEMWDAIQATQKTSRDVIGRRRRRFNRYDQDTRLT